MLTEASKLMSDDLNTHGPYIQNLYYLFIWTNCTLILIITKQIVDTRTLRICMIQKIFQEALKYPNG